MKHTVKHLGFPEAPVEAVTEFRQVTGQVLWTDTMMDTTNIAFDIGDQGVDPGQDLRRLFPRTGNESLMAVGQSIQKAISLPTVGFDHHFFHQTRPYQGLNLLGADSRAYCITANLGLYHFRIDMQQNIANNPSKTNYLRGDCHGSTESGD